MEVHPDRLRMQASESRRDEDRSYSRSSSSSYPSRHSHSSGHNSSSSSSYGRGGSSSNSNSYTKVDLAVAPSRIGVLIGKRGESIKLLQEHTRIRIQIDSQDAFDGTRAVHLSGPADRVEQARLEIEAIVAGTKLAPTAAHPHPQDLSKEQQKALAERSDRGGQNTSSNDSQQLDRDWYSEGDSSSGANMMLSYEKTAGKRLNARQLKAHAENTAWEDSRLRSSGVGKVGHVDTDFDAEIENRVHILVHDMKPPFLDGRMVFTKQQEMVAVVKDPTSDFAVIAANGSAKLQSMRENKDRKENRVKYWELAGTDLGNLTGVKKEPGLESDGVEVRVCVVCASMHVLCMYVRMCVCLWLSAYHVHLAYVLFLPPS
jgi:hypothetical protein